MCYLFSAQYLKSLPVANIFLQIYLKTGKEKKNNERVFHLQVLFSNVHNSWGWIKMNPVFNSSICASHMGVRTKVPVTSHAFFPDASGQTWIRSRASKTSSRDCAGAHLGVAEVTGVSLTLLHHNVWHWESNSIQQDEDIHNKENHRGGQFCSIS